MKNEQFKTQMFRFVDALPMLTTSASVTRHLHEYFHEVDRHLPGAMRLGLSIAPPGSVTGRALAIAAPGAWTGLAAVAGTGLSNTTRRILIGARDRIDTTTLD